MSKEEIEKAIGRIREEYFINGIGARYTEVYTDDLKILLDYADGLEKFNREVIEHKTNLECKIGELEEERELRIHYENRLDNMEQLYVDKDKIRDKIEELKNKIEELSDDEGYWGSQSLLDQVELLEELLEEG